MADISHNDRREHPQKGADAMIINGGGEST
jgi:hypothetical protein